MKIFSDGFVIFTNPSEIGGGFTLVDENENLIKREVIEKKNFTNNEAEVLGVIEAAKLCNTGDTISTDSMNTISWMKNGKSKSRPDLNEQLMEGKKLISEKGINLIWESRDDNLAGWLNETDRTFEEGIRIT